MNYPTKCHTCTQVAEYSVKILLEDRLVTVPLCGPHTADAVAANISKSITPIEAT